jgi:hypothetical protein
MAVTTVACDADTVGRGRPHLSHPARSGDSATVGDEHGVEHR